MQRLDGTTDARERPGTALDLAGRSGASETDLELLADGALGVAEAVKFSGVCRTALYAAMERGELPFTKRGRRRLIPRRGLVRWLAEGLQGVGHERA